MCKHTGEKPFKCDIDGCAKNYTTAANLRAHQKRHGIKAVVGKIHYYEFPFLSWKIGARW